MRSFVAILLMALLSLPMAMTVVGCGGQNAPETTTTETQSMPDESMTPPEDMAMDSTMADTTMQH